jgi:hypothetical protein
MFGCGRKRKELRMTPQGKRFYSIDMDRPCHIRDVKGELLHRYLDETVWRDAQGRVLEQQPTQETK